MKRLAVILSVVILTVVFLTSCAVIDQRYTGKRIHVAPDEYEYRDYDYAPRGDYYDPYYSFYYDPFFWTGLSFWNPFWHYGFINYWNFGYYPYYWGYYPSYWGGWYYYPRWGGRYYPSYRSNYRYVIRKNQLSGTRSYRVPTVRTKSSSGNKGRVTSIRSRSVAPSTRISSSRTTSTRTSSRTTIKKKK